MKAITATSLLALIGVAAAQSIPSCALSCFTSAVQDTSCSLLDAYCQCSTGAATIAKEALPCVCNDSDCSDSEIADVAKASYDICVSAFSASSQTYTVTPLATNFCKSLGSGSGATSSATPAANSAESTASAASASSSSSSAASDNKAAAPTNVGIQGAMLGAGALALLAL